MAGTKPDPLAELAVVLGHRFRRRGLLAEAVTHASVTEGGVSYQRLEFLGDRVLGLAVADMLVRTFPDEAEGDLARRHAALVRAEALRAVAEAIELRRYLRFSDADPTIADGDNAGILADAMEAVLGALYLDGGLEPAARFIEARWRALLSTMTAPPQDAKTALQEWAQARGMPLPSYSEVARSGPDHAPQFTVEVRVAGRPPARAAAASKRVAEQTAAERLLAALRDG